MHTKSREEDGEEEEEERKNRATGVPVRSDAIVAMKWNIKRERRTFHVNEK